MNTYCSNCSAGIPSASEAPLEPDIAFGDAYVQIAGQDEVYVDTCCYQYLYYDFQSEMWELTMDQDLTYTTE